MDETYLRRRAWTGAVSLLIALWLILFLPAWSLGYWQAWIYWLLVSAYLILITQYFVKTRPELLGRRPGAGPAAGEGPGQTIIQAVRSISFILLLIVPGFDHRLGWSAVPLPGVIAGDLLAVAGLVIVFITFRESRYTQTAIRVEKDQAVVSTGPYAVVRHPMYAGICLLLIATPFALGSVWALLPALPAVAAIILRLLGEEKYLTNHLPGYPEYCRKTRYRLIPRIW
jgi:protein-S-isoprenylcysteine O-methyltransferase Ste14